MHRFTKAFLFLAFLALAELLLSAGTSVAQNPTGAASNGPAQESAAPQPQQPRDPLLDLPPLPHNRVALIGGTVTKLDPVQDRLTVRAFGGGTIQIRFDVRTHVYSDGAPVREEALKQGQRVYVDTMLDGDKVFAKSIRIDMKQPTGEGRGQVIEYDARNRVLRVRDVLSSQPATFQLLPSTVIRQGNQNVSVGDLVPGSLVSLKFGPRTERHPTLQEISIIAKPGTRFSFFGLITYVDMSNQLIAVDNNPDNKNYEISTEDIPQDVARSLHEGEKVGISAIFDGRNYVAQTIQPAP
jgi:Domain of unknown function (DUF5666)